MTAEKPQPDEAIPFSEWMRRALFDPATGYYTRHIRTVGRRGDFSTAASVGESVGAAVAHWITKETRRWREVRTVIEIGGGDGSLMRSVRRGLGFFTRRKLRFYMVESSPPLLAQQQSALAGAGVTWFDDLSAALQSCHGRAFLFHNELLDAFPVLLAEWDGQSWHEIWLARNGATWSEQKRELSLDHPTRRAFSALDQRPASTRQRVELGTDARKWLGGWAPHWCAGSMLTLDYGGGHPALYDRRPDGTLRAYLFQQRLTGPAIYDHMGRQDITADVNFTDLMRWGEALGWETSSLETQRDFLRHHVPDFEQKLRRESGLQFLADDHGAGSAFQALVQRVKP